MSTSVQGDVFKFQSEEEEEEEDTQLKPSEDADVTVLFTRPVNTNGKNITCNTTSLTALY